MTVRVREETAPGRKKEAVRVIIVSELQQLAGLKNLRLTAGKEGLGRSASKAMLWDIASSGGHLPDSCEDCIILADLFLPGKEEAQLQSGSGTALVPARTEGLPAEDVDRMLEEFICKKPAALLIWSAQLSALPESAMRLADASGMPVFLYDNEDIPGALANVVDLIRSRRFRGYEKELQMLMQGRLEEKQVRECLERMGMDLAMCMAILAFFPEDCLDRMEEALSRTVEDRADADRYACLEVDGMLFVLRRLESEESFDGVSECAAMIERMKLPTDAKFGIGISSVLEDTSQIGSALCEADIAARVSLYGGGQPVRGETLGLDAYLFPMLQSGFLVSRCLQDYALLQDYDAENHTSLTETAEMYLQKNLDVSETARVMYQHANTIRYRIRKIKALLGCESEPVFITQLCLMIRLKQLIDRTKR